MKRKIENIKSINVFGVKIGILLLDTRTPRALGDIGNALTFKFPVVYKVVKGATVHKIVNTVDKSLIEPFVNAAKELIKTAGISAVTSSCGFTAVFQEELAKSLDISVFMSNLLQVPLVSRMIGEKRQVGIITANKKRLTNQHLRGVGITKDIPICIAGMEDQENFANMLLDKQEPFGDIDKIEMEMINVAKTLLKNNKGIGALVLECANMSPFSYAIQRAVDLPVFDIIDFINYIHMAVCKKKYQSLYCDY